MKTILIASLLAFINDPVTGAGGPTCEDELLECQDDQELAHEAIEALIDSIDDLTTDPTGGGGAQPCTSQICQIVDACRRSQTSNLGKCVEEGCGGPLGCL